MLLKVRGTATLIALVASSAATSAAQVPVIALKPANASLAEEFTVVASIRELADGRVLITDERENRLVVADFRTSAVSPIARLGSGPGEYRRVGRLWAIPGDSTIVPDIQAARWLLLHGARVVATVPSNDPGLTPGRGGMLEGADAIGGVITLVHGGHRFRRPTDQDSMRIRRYDRYTKQTREIGRVTSPFERYGKMVIEVPAAEGVVAGPARYPMGGKARDQIAVFADGWIAFARVKPYRVDWCRPDGKCTTGPTIERFARMSDGDKRAYLAWADARVYWRKTIKLEETVDWPELLSPFHVPPQGLDASALLPMPDGRVLIDRVPQAGRVHSQHDIIDRQGKLVATLNLPLNERVIGFGARSVYIVSTDEFGLQRLRRHPWP
jgi:hypothetical protein